ncbi:MAG: PcfJ domain-containing protein [Clostridia bacterium]|nr:PcfJ domain-containing protein [Clostridia bacterium]
MKKPSREQIDDAMKYIPDLPQDFINFINKEMLKRNRYLFYKREKKKVVAVCSKCGETVELKKAAHNGSFKCPSCNVKAVTKAINKAKQYQFSEIFTIVQRVKLGESEGIVIKYVKAYINFKHYDDTSDFPVNILSTLVEPKITRYEGSRELWWDHHGQTKLWLLENEWKWETNEYKWVNERKRGYYFNRELLRDSDPIVYKRNIKRLIKKTPWKYCGIEYFKFKNFNVGDYIQSYIKCNELEYLVKTGLQNLAKEVVNHAYSYSGSEKIRDLKKLSKVSMKQVRKYDLDSYGVETILWTQEKNISLTEEQLKWLIEYRHHDKIKELLKHTTLTKIINHIEKQTELRDFAASLWVDYLSMSVKLGKDISKSVIFFPKEIKKLHDELVYLVAEEENAKTEAGLAEFWEKWHSILDYRKKDLQILTPRTQKEFIAAGSTLKICVWSNGYAKRMAEGKTIVLFIYKQNGPYFALELDKDFSKIKQLHGYDHLRATPEVQKLVDKWHKDTLKKLNEKNLLKSA